MKFKRKNISEHLQRGYFPGWLLIKKCVDPAMLINSQEARWTMERQIVPIKTALYEEIYESTGIKLIRRNPHGITLGDLLNEE